ncbi:hypothetical protein [Sutcliffiella rhizosphaerae]|uniref:Uncharacterized protein n=1 Tax=Sutcliffiella rhizosphaerae TaxID=2880967 RepID=A0ABN8AEU9_9BACI|nr:hypothetical protein [Sutcliffiella rhizosphaerae]CAG9622596.1 hypothetical protein BACCIP111883_03387 [Sutcliffiella rhizosphaerae]
MKNKEKERELHNRNNKQKAFKQSKENQKERDQLVMPIDELPLEEIKYEKEEERDKKDSKDRSSSNGLNK